MCMHSNVRLLVHRNVFENLLPVNENFILVLQFDVTMYMRSCLNHLAYILKIKFLYLHTYIVYIYMYICI